MDILITSESVWKAEEDNMQVGNLSSIKEDYFASENEASQIGVSWSREWKKWMKPLKTGHSWGEIHKEIYSQRGQNSKMPRDSLAWVTMYSLQLLSKSLIAYLVFNWQRLYYPLWYF